MGRPQSQVRQIEPAALRLRAVFTVLTCPGLWFTEVKGRHIKDIILLFYIFFGVGTLTVCYDSPVDLRYPN